MPLLHPDRRMFLASSAGFGIAALAAPPVLRAQGAPQPVRLAMAASVMTVGFFYLYLPERLGYWKEEGLSVQTLLTQGSAQAVQLVAAGQADLCLTNPEAVVLAKQRNLPFRSISTIFVQGTVSVAVAPASPVQSIADLKGKKVGVVSLASGNVHYFRARVAEAGLAPASDVTLVAVGAGPTAAEALRSGAVDALVLWRSAFTALENAGVPLRYLPPSPWEKDIYSYIGSALEGVIAAREETVGRVLRGIAKALEFGAAVPKAATQTFWTHYPDAINTRIDRARAFANDTRIVEGTLIDAGLHLDSYPKPPQRQWGAQATPNWTLLLDYMKRTEQVASTGDPGSYFTDRFTGFANTFDKAAVAQQARALRTEF